MEFQCPHLLKRKYMFQSPEPYLLISELLTNLH